MPAMGNHDRKSETADRSDFFRGKAMRYDIWDMDEGAWSCWDPERGYLCGWLKKKDYETWWFVNYGVVGRRLPSAHTM